MKYRIPTQLTIAKDMDVYSVHNLILPEDVFEINEIIREAQLMPNKSYICVHYQYGMYIIYRTKCKYFIKIAYLNSKNKYDTIYRIYNTTKLYEVIYATKNFLSGNYKEYLRKYHLNDTRNK